MAFEMVNRGAIGDLQAEELIEILIKDLARYPIEAIQHAVRMHRERKAFWPALSELMPFLNEKMEPLLREAERLRVIGNRLENAQGYEQPPLETRKAQAAQARQVAADIEREGAEADSALFNQGRTPRTRKDGPPAWHDPEQLKASLRRLMPQPEQSEFVKTP